MPLPLKVSQRTGSSNCTSGRKVTINSTWVIPLPYFSHAITPAILSPRSTAPARQCLALKNTWSLYDIPAFWNLHLLLSQVQPGQGIHPFKLPVDRNLYVSQCIFRRLDHLNIQSAESFFFAVAFFFLIVIDPLIVFHPFSSCRYNSH